MDDEILKDGLDAETEGNFLGDEMEFSNPYQDLTVYKDPWKTDQREIITIAKINIELKQLEKELEINEDFFLLEIGQNCKQNLREILDSNNLYCSSRIWSLIGGYEFQARLNQPN